METVQVTLQMLQDDGLIAGDSVISRITYTLKKDMEVVVKESSTYKVDEIYPPEEPMGFVIVSEIGRWYFNFATTDGGGKYFDKVISVSEEDELGEFGTIPLDIVTLILNKPGIKRNEIVEYLSYKASANSPKTRANIRNQIIESLRFLEVRGYIEIMVNTLNKYEISAKGLKLIGWDKPKYKIHTEEA